MHAYNYPDNAIWDYEDSIYKEREYLNSLEETVVKYPDDAMECIIKFLVDGEDIDLDLIAQSLNILSEEMGHKVEKKINQDDITMIPLRKFRRLQDDLEKSRVDEGSRIRKFTQTLISEICGSSDLSIRNVEISLSNLMYITHRGGNLEPINKINVRRS